MLIAICLVFTLQITTNSALDKKLISYSLKTKFPIYERENFTIEFTGTEKKLPIYSTIIFICKLNDKILQEENLYPGFLKVLPESIKGDYFHIVNLTVKSNRVEVILLFEKLANKNLFESIFFETDSPKIRQEIVDKQEYTKYKLGSFNISLLFHWKLELIEKSLDLREDGIHLNSTGNLICKATGGFPFSRARFIGTEQLDQQRLTVENDTENAIRLTFLSRIEDHLKKFGCQAGNDILYKRIRIFHRPTTLIFTPPISSQFVRNGTSILCQSQDGYPPPNVQWSWISGPNNSQQFYKIYNQDETRAILEIGGNAPLESSWKFKCNAANIIQNKWNNGVVQIISFQIGDKPISLIVVVVIVVSIIIFLVLFTCAAYHLRKRKTAISQTHSSDYFIANTHNTASNQFDPDKKYQSGELLLQKYSSIKSIDTINNSIYSMESQLQKDFFYPIDEV